MSKDFTFSDSSSGRVQIYGRPELLDELQTVFSYQRKQYGSVTGGLNFPGTGVYSCISPTYTIKTGLTFEIAKYLKNNGYSFEIDKDLKQKIQPTCNFINNEKLIQPDAAFTYRDYQERAIHSVKRYGRGILSSPTSSGKSLILFGICSNIKEFSERTLIIVPRIQLVEQFYKEWTSEYGFVGAATFSKKNPELDPNAKVIITNYQWLVAKGNTSNANRKDLLLIKKGNFKAVIVDECHTIGDAGSWLSRFIGKLNANYIIGCTGTVPEDKAKYWNLVGLVGPVIFKEEIHKLQERNQIAKIRINAYRFSHANKKSEMPWAYNGGIIVDKVTREPLDATKMYNAEYKYIESHNFCNNYILEFAEKIQGNTVILVDHIPHAEYLFDNCKFDNKFLITGKTDLDKRSDLSALVDSKDGKKYIIIAITSCFGTGVSIKNISNLIVCTHGKALTKVIQSLGRVLRKVLPDGKEEYGYLYDFTHNLMFAKKHFKRKCQLYKQFYKKDATRYIKEILVPECSQNEIRVSSIEKL